MGSFPRGLNATCGISSSAAHSRLAACSCAEEGFVSAAPVAGSRCWWPQHAAVSSFTAVGLGPSLRAESGGVVVVSARLPLSGAKAAGVQGRDASVAPGEAAGEEEAANELGGSSASVGAAAAEARFNAIESVLSYDIDGKSGPNPE
jgi:hypothetical protein